MYKVAKPNRSLIKQTFIMEGETIEHKIRRIVNNGEPITDGTKAIYTERKDGVQPEFNPRTDKWDLAIDAMDVVSKNHLAQRKGVKMEPIEGGKKGENDGGPESIQGTSGTTD